MVKGGGLKFMKRSELRKIISEEIKNLLKEGKKQVYGEFLKKGTDYLFIYNGNKMIGKFVEKRSDGYLFDVNGKNIFVPKFSSQFYAVQKMPELDKLLKDLEDAESSYQRKYDDYKWIKKRGGQFTNDDGNIEQTQTLAHAGIEYKIAWDKVQDIKDQIEKLKEKRLR